MPLTTIIVCTDGSDLARDAAVAGLAILQTAERVVVATVVEREDESAVVGSGMAGGVMSHDEFARLERERAHNGQAIAEQTAELLGPSTTEIRVLQGDPGPALCGLANELAADALVMSTRGLGRIRRALLGSVSEYVIRNSSCPVVIVGAAG